MKFYFSLAFCLSFMLCGFAQNAEQHSTGEAWLSPDKGAKGAELTVNVKLTPEPGWHVYSTIDNGAYMPTVLDVEAESKGIALVGKVTEAGELISEYDELMDGDMNYFKADATFSQKVKVSKQNAMVVGRIDYQECNDMKCIFSSYEFELPVNAE